MLYQVPEFHVGSLLFYSCDKVRPLHLSVFQLEVVVLHRALDVHLGEQSHHVGVVHAVLCALLDAGRAVLDVHALARAQQQQHRVHRPLREAQVDLSVRRIHVAVPLSTSPPSAKRLMYSHYPHTVVRAPAVVVKSSEGHVEDVSAWLIPFKNLAVSASLTSVFVGESEQSSQSRRGPS